jgi:X-X-X-Leu-X-X-Gly heptad repeat protein
LRFAGLQDMAAGLQDMAAGLQDLAAGFGGYGCRIAR